MSLLILVSLLGQGPLVEPAPILIAAPPPSDERRNAFDFLVGSPLGLTLRLQHQLNAAPLYVEGYLGTWLLGAGVGAGLRTEFSSELGPCDLFVARPGGAFYYIALSEIISSRSSAGAVVLDVDLAWQHRYSGGTIGELGFKIGPGVSLYRDNLEVFPVFAIYHGWRF